MVKQLTFFLLLFVVVVACADDYIFATGRDGTEIVYTADRMIYTNWLGDCILWHPFPSDVGGGSYPDYSTEQNDGSQSTATNRPTWSSGSYDFNGVNEYIDCGNDASLQINTSNITVAFWVKKADTVSAHPANKYDGASAGWYIILDYKGTNNIYWRPAAATLELSVTLLNNWHHIVIAQSGTVASIYVDGDYVDQFTGCYETASVTASFFIGVDQGPTFFDGFLDDFRNYKIALTSNQVNQIYLDTKGAH